jgi:hypothetical protein
MAHLHATHKIMGCFIIAAASLLIASLGCQTHPQRLNAPPQGATHYSHELQEPMMTMTDNALLADMSVAPVHFVPSQPELNGTGARRLKRMANILKVYGGKVHYTGYGEPEDLTSQRIDKIREYLLAEGIEGETFEVAQGLAGGRGMAATEAIAIREGSRYCPEEDSSGSSCSAGALPETGLGESK